MVERIVIPNEGRCSVLVCLSGLVLVKFSQNLPLKNKTAYSNKLSAWAHFAVKVDLSIRIGQFNAIL